VRFTLGRKLGLSFGVILALAVIGSAISFLKLVAVMQNLDMTFELRFPSSLAAKDLQRDINMTSVKARQAILAGSEPNRRDVAVNSWKKTWDTVDKDLAALDQLAPKWVIPVNRDRLAQIRGELSALRDSQQQSINHAVGGSNDVVKAGEEYTDHGTAAADAARQTLGAMADSFQDLMDKNKKSTRSTVRSLEMTLSVTTSVALCFGIAAALFLTTRITASLRRLTEMIKDIADGEGDVTKRLEAAGNFGDDELGEVSRLFNRFMDKLQEILRGVSNQSNKLMSSSQQLLAASQQITVNSGETAQQSSSVARVTQQVSQNLQNLSNGFGEMTSTIQSIAANAHDAARVATSAVSAAQTADATVAKLGQSSAEIGDVAKVITAIAQQTNLLALNATIEAARAGEAGKGFAVVANEVKELASQTARATKDIGGKITAIQVNTKGAATAIGTVGGVIDKINAISATIAAAVEQQSATTNEMTRNAGEAAQGAGDISVNIGSVAQAAEGTSARAQESYKAAQELVRIATQLNDLMRQFKIERGEPRHEISVSVALSATDAEGHPFEQQVMTVNVSQTGALLAGVHGKLRLGGQVTLSRDHKREQFSIAWLGEAKTSRSGQIGVIAADPATSFWNDLIGNQSQAVPSAERRHSGKVAAKPKAKAQGA
jgi:methyl-accepting chemotaxis protein